LHTVGVGESQIDDLIGDLEALPNPTVGLAAHSGQVDVRITAKAASEKFADELISPIETTLRDRLGDFVYGVDQETLEDIALSTIIKKNWSFAILEAGSGGLLIRRLAASKGSFVGGQLLKKTLDAEELLLMTDSYRQSRGAEVGFGVAFHNENERQYVVFALITPLEKRDICLPYGGTPDYASIWTLHQSLNIIRRI
jgi:nicotinamide-nucleotide amidase